MNSKTKPAIDAMLTVREAAALTNLSVPTFYTEQRKRDFGYVPGSKDVWLIPIQLLVDHGLLTKDGEPTRQKKSFGSQADNALNSELAQENAWLKEANSDLENRIKVLEMLVEEKDKQLAMVNSLINKIGGDRK